MVKSASTDRGRYGDPDLTPRQRRILEVIEEWIGSRGYAPSMREIGDAVGLTSTSSVHAQVAALERKGYIARDPSKPRKLALLANVEVISGRSEDELTPRQGEILEVLRRAAAESDYPPSLEEIAEAAGLVSTSSVRAALTELQRKGFLRRARGKSRAIELREQAPEGRAKPRPAWSSPGLIGATDLVLWANRRDAQQHLPQLIRRLILATTSGVTRIRFPAGEGVQQAGPDGTVETQAGNAFVPEGLSFWEVSTNRNTRLKVEHDVERFEGSLATAEATFVFVTPRRWAAKDDWATQRSSEGRWRQVRVYDADDLEAWLELSPAVHAWISTLLGKDPGIVQDLESRWLSWAEVTSPPLSAELVISGREEAAEQVLERLAGAPAAFGLIADSPDEALAFFAACVQRLPADDRDALLSRALVVRDATVWREVVGSQSPLLLVPLVEEVDIASAVRGGHHVLIPLGRDTARPGDEMQLPRLRRSAARDALQAMGMPAQRVDALATLAHRSLLSLRRQLAFSPVVKRPAWAQPDEARAVLPAVLAGAWDESQEGDREVLARLAGQPYEQVARALTRWSSSSDPPVRRVGTTWLLVDKEDAWQLLARFLTGDDLRRLGDAVVHVLGEIDPALYLPVEERWKAHILGRSRPQSDLLREGLADTLAFLGARDVTLPGGSTGQQHADRIIHELLGRANSDKAGDSWASLCDLLPLLAEAAPDVFLEEVDEGSSTDPPILSNLFVDASQQSAVFVSSPHTGLLWALETVAWSQDYLGRVARLLARLARLDPGGRLGNRPASSFREIFLLWHPQTTAPLDRRLGVLDALREREPAVAWDLLIQLLPQLYDHALDTHAPRWREWTSEEKRHVTVAELYRATRELATRLLKDVGTDGQRWRDLVERLPALPRDVQDAIIQPLLSMNAATIAEPGRTILRDTLRDLIAHHRQYPDEEWAMPREQVDRLAEVYRRLEPDDPVQRYAWLFTHHPELPSVSTHDWQDSRRAIDTAQDEAVRAVYEVGGLPAVIDLARAAEQPREVGRAVGRIQLLRLNEHNILAGLAAPDRARQQLARGYVVGRFYPQDWVWAERLLEHRAPAWKPALRAGFLLSLPSSRRTWDWVERFDQETEREYWSQFLAHGLDQADDSTRAATKLLRHDRPHAAVDLLALYAGQGRPEPQVVAEALERAAQTQPGADVNPTMWVHDTVRLLDYLETSGALAETRLARLEWTYLPMLGHQRPARLLHRQLAQDPAFFADIVCWVFRAEDEEQREVTTEERTRAALGYRLLDSWHEVPGQRDDGTIDPQTLQAWINQARELLAARGRASIGDQRIGHALCHVPAGSDGAWPAEAVRDVIERTASRGLELGLEIEVHNSRGATWRALTEGGRQEWELARPYHAAARIVSDRWPRTAALLRRIAKSLEADARREDKEAELREDLWR